MSSTHAVECPVGASIKDNCQTDSLEYVVLDIDEKETLQLRSGCDASVHSVCQYHWHKYFKIYICKQRICLDPFGKHKKIVTKGLRVITLEAARLHHELNLIPGKKLSNLSSQSVETSQCTCSGITAYEWCIQQ